MYVKEYVRLLFGRLNGMEFRTNTMNSIEITLSQMKEDDQNRAIIIFKAHIRNRAI